MRRMNECEVVASVGGFKPVEEGKALRVRRRLVGGISSVWDGRPTHLGSAGLLDELGPSHVQAIVSYTSIAMSRSKQTWTASRLLRMRQGRVGVAVSAGHRALPFLGLDLLSRLELAASSCFGGPSGGSLRAGAVYARRYLSEADQGGKGNRQSVKQRVRGCCDEAKSFRAMECGTSVLSSGASGRVLPRTLCEQSSSSRASCQDGEWESVVVVVVGVMCIVLSLSLRSAAFREAGRCSARLHTCIPH